jgi:hypothetical protein
MVSTKPEWVTDFMTALNVLYDNVQEFAKNETDLAAMCEVLVEVSNMKTSLALIYDDVANTVKTRMSHGELIATDNGATIECKMSKDRKGWQHQDLANIVADRIRTTSVDIETGEVLLSQHEMITKLLDYIQPSYWRVGKLQEIGIDADDYCTVGESKQNLVIRKGQK